MIRRIMKRERGNRNKQGRENQQKRITPLKLLMNHNARQKLLVNAEETPISPLWNQASQ